MLAYFILLLSAERVRAIGLSELVSARELATIYRSEMTSDKKYCAQTNGSANRVIGTWLENGLNPTSFLAHLPFRITTISRFPSSIEIVFVFSEHIFP